MYNCVKHLIIYSLFIVKTCAKIGNGRQPRHTKVGEAEQSALERRKTPGETTASDFVLPSCPARTCFGSHSVLIRSSFGPRSMLVRCSFDAIEAKHERRWSEAKAAQRRPLAQEKQTAKYGQGKAGAATEINSVINRKKISFFYKKSFTLWCFTCLLG